MKSKAKITIYTMPGNVSCRKAVEHFENIGEDVKVKNIKVQMFSFEEMKQILSLSENGVEDILSEKSKPYRKLTAEGLDFDTLSLSELHTYFVKHPELIKVPITLTDMKMVVGYRNDAFEVFKPRAERVKSYLRMLDGVAM